MNSKRLGFAEDCKSLRPVVDWRVGGQGEPAETQPYRRFYRNGYRYVSGFVTMAPLAFGAGGRRRRDPSVSGLGLSPDS